MLPNWFARIIELLTKRRSGAVQSCDHERSVVTDAGMPATCKTPGLTEGEHCAVCGAVIKAQEVIPAHGHTIVIDEVVAPTCTETGLTEGEHCAVCGEVIKAQEVIPAHGHTIIIDEAVASTCRETGLTEGEHCAVCGAVIKAQEEIPAHGHTIVIDEVVAPTCTETGLTEGEHCAVCGEVIKAQEEIPAHGHTIIIDEAVAPTCTETGLTEGEHCAVCGAVIKAQEVIPAHGHTIIIDEAVAPTCRKTGLTEGTHCAVCGEVIKAQKEIPALGHSIVTDEAIAPTCTNAGLTEGRHCVRCNAVIMPQEPIPALGHDPETLPGWPATSARDGMTDGARCRRCGAILTEQTLIPRLAAPSTASGRLEALTREPATNWPLNRMLAFGAALEEYEAADAKLPKGTTHKLGAIETDQGGMRWLDRLDNAAWERAFALCTAIDGIRAEHSLGTLIAKQRSSGAQSDEICRTFKVSELEMRRELNGYVNAVTDLFLKHNQALDFLYPDNTFDQRLAETFFGKVTYDRIARCCDMAKIHARRSQRQVKAIALTASDQMEASNQRTKVLTNWEHLKNYIIEQFDSQPILGSIELDEQEYGLLIDYLHGEYKRRISRSGGENTVDRVVCVALVQIALRCPGARYWREVANAMGEKETIALYNLGKCFLRTMQQYKKATYATSEYVASIKLHTFVANAYIPDLFEFLYSYYELDLGRNMEFADLEELRRLMTSGAYFSRQQLIRQQTIDALKLIPASLNRLKTYLGWIDAAFWQQGWQPDHDDRFSRAFREWCACRDEFNGRWSGSASDRRRGKRMHTRPTMTLDTRTSQINLLLPVQRLPFDCDDAAGWRITDGGERKYTLHCELVESITGVKTEEMAQALPRDGLLDAISIEFYNGENTIRSYTIPADCVRMFNGQGALITGKRVPEGRVFFLTRHQTRVETESEGVQLRFDPWGLRVVELREGETVIFPDDTLAVVGSDAMEGLCGGHPVPGAWVREPDGEQRYPVYGQLPSFLLKVTEDQFAKTRFQLNDRYYTAQEVHHRRLTLHERTSDTGYLVTLPAPNGEFSLCHVNINVPGDGHQRDWTFCHWPDFSYAFDNGAEGLPYWDTGSGAVKLNTPIPMRGENVKPGGAGEYGFKVDPEPTPLAFLFDRGGTAYVLDIDVPALAWRQEEDPWTMAPLGEIWHKGFPDAIDIRTQAEEVWLYVDSDGLKNGQSVCCKRRKDEDTIHCDLLALKQWFTRDRIMHTVRIHIGERDVGFANVYCRSHLAVGRLEARYNTGEFHGSFDIIGQGRYSVSLFREEEEVLSQVPVADGAFTAAAPLRSGAYTAVVYEAVEDDFGFDLTWDEIGRTNVKLLNPGDLTGSVMEVKHLDTVDGKPEELALRGGCIKVKLVSRIQCEGVVYAGMLRDTTGITEQRYTVFVEYPDLDAIDHCKILLNDDGERLSFVYDRSHKHLVPNSNPKVPFMERCRRYITLDEEDTYTVVYETD